MLTIRPEKKEDFPEITNINNAAFGQINEGHLVESLRLNENYMTELSLVAIVDDKLVGHILFFPIRIMDGKYQHESIALAPMSVHPSYQKKGIGSALIREGLSRCRHAGFESVIVLGHPEYYLRFGFKPARRWKITAPFSVPLEAFMALELEEHGLRNIQGVARYPEEFNAV